MTIQEQMLADLLDAIPNRMDCLRPSHEYKFYFEWETGSLGLSRVKQRVAGLCEYNSPETSTTLTFKVKGQEAPLIFSRDTRVDCMYDTLQNLIETKQFAPYTMSVKDFVRR